MEGGRCIQELDTEGPGTLMYTSWPSRVSRRSSPLVLVNHQYRVTKGLTKERMGAETPSIAYIVDRYHRS